MIFAERPFLEKNPIIIICDKNRKGFMQKPLFVNAHFFTVAKNIFVAVNQYQQRFHMCGLSITPRSRVAVEIPL